MSALEKLQLDLNLTLASEKTYRAKLKRLSEAEAIIDRKVIIADDGFQFGRAECALCGQYLSRTHSCAGCPIALKAERHYCEKTPFRFMFNGFQTSLDMLRFELSDIIADGDMDENEFNRRYDRLVQQCAREAEYLRKLAGELQINIDRILSKTTPPT